MIEAPDQDQSLWRHEQDILALQEQERRRIGRVIHDDLGQRLAAASYMGHALASSLAADGSPLAKQAADLRSLLDDAHSLIRALARGLHPSPVTAAGLVGALDELAAETCSMFEVACEFHHAGGAIPPLGDEAANHLVYIARESVCNAVHHGKASRIRIELAARAGRMVLSISDDGCGLHDQASNETGLGMRIMKCRASLIGGKLTTSAAKGGGTVIACTLPGSLAQTPSLDSGTGALMVTHAD